MKIAALQSDIVWEDPEANFARLRPRIRAAKAAGADFVLLPEFYACGFTMHADQVCEPPQGPSARFLHEQAEEHGIWICGSRPELAPGGTKPTNTLVLAGPKGQDHRYRKIHPFTFAREHEHYDAGTEFLTVELHGVRTTFFICYDLRFADEFWNTARETDLFVVVANWPEKRRHHWSLLLQARAIENQAFVVGLNRIGMGGTLSYSGDSAIIDPWGEILASASRDETTLLGDIDAGRVAEARTKFPVLNDRR